MRRPMALAGFTLLLTDLFCILWGTSFAKIAGIVVLVALCGLLYIQKYKPNSRQITALSGCFLLAVCGCFTYTIWAKTQIEPLAVHYNTTQTVEFTVLEQDGVYDTACYYTVDVLNLYPDSDKALRVRLSADNPCPLQPGDVVKGTLTFSQPGAARQTRDYSNRIYLSAKLTQYTLCDTNHSLSYYIQSAQTYIRQVLNTGADSQASAMITGICLGDASGLTVENSQNFTKAGMRHLVAVSGLHTNTVGGIFVGAFLFLGTKKRWLKVSSLAFVWIFALLTGCSYSSLRAALMFTVYAVAYLFFRRADPLNTLGIAVTVILLLNPFAAGNIGFLASVSACVGILVLYQPLHRFVSRYLPKRFKENPLGKGILTGMCVTVSANLALIPCNLLAFRNYSLFSPLANLIGVPVAGFILCLGVFAVLLSLLPGLSLITQILLYLAGLLAKLLLLTARIFSGPSAFLLQQTTPACYIAFGVVLMGAILLYRYRSRLSSFQQPIIALLLAILLMGSSFLPAYPADTYELLFITNGYDMTVGIIGNEQTVLIGCHNAYTVQTLLQSRGKQQVDVWILPGNKTYGTNLTDFPHYLTVNTLMTHRDTARDGYLTPITGVKTITHQPTVQVGEIRVVANQTFDEFTLTVGGKTIVHSQKEDVTGQCCYQIIDSLSFDQPVALLDNTGQPPVRYTLTQTTVLRLSHNSNYLYTPRFIFH